MNPNEQTLTKFYTAFTALDAIFEKQSALASQSQSAEVSGDKRLNLGGPHELV